MSSSVTSIIFNFLNMSVMLWCQYIKRWYDVYMSVAILPIWCAVLEYSSYKIYLGAIILWNNLNQNVSFKI